MTILLSFTRIICLIHILLPNWLQLSGIVQNVASYVPVM